MVRATPTLPLELLFQIFERLPTPQDLSRVSQVCRGWYQVAQDHRLWLRWCLAYSVPPQPIRGMERENAKERGKDMFMTWPTNNAEICRRAREAFVEWHVMFEGFHVEYKKIKIIVERLTTVLTTLSPLTRMALQPGRQTDFKEMVLETAARLPADVHDMRTLLMFYHFFEGQRPRLPHIDVGLFGSYLCYGQYISIIMLPSKYLKLETAHGLTFIVFADCPRSGKYLALVTGGFYELQGHVIELDEHNGLYISHGLFLDFLTNYVEALEAGDYELHNEQAISLFRNRGEFTSTCETRGIRISASSICNLENATLAGVWTYRITLEHLFSEYGVFRQCQLASRHWYIHYASGLVEEVQGDGVVGHSPILSRERPKFSYCSIVQGRTNDDDSVDIPVRMKGTFTFVPGTILDPAGEPFLAHIDSFDLQQPISLLNQM